MRGCGEFERKKKGVAVTYLRVLALDSFRSEKKHKILNWIRNYFYGTGRLITVFPVA
jgi:hypothetical protein